MISWFEKHSKISWVIVVLIGIFIFYMSSLTFPPSDAKGIDIKPFVYHFAVFFFFSSFLLFSIVKGRKENLVFLIFLVILLSVLYATSDEIHQIFVPGRGSSISDVLIDSFGILLASFFYVLSIRFRGEK